MSTAVAVLVAIWAGCGLIVAVFLTLETRAWHREQQHNLRALHGHQLVHALDDLWEASK